jgi:nucleoside-specific outer membrane channel protein Tsx
MSFLKLLPPLALALLSPAPASAADWSDFNVQLLHGTGYEEPGTPHHITKTIATFEYANSYRWGDNYAYLDVSKFRNATGALSGQPEGPLDFFGEWHHLLSASRVAGRPVAFGPVKDVGLWTAVIGGVYGGEFRSEVRAAIVGVGLQLPAPEYGFQLVKAGAYFSDERNAFGPVDTRTSWRVAHAWSLPFHALGAGWRFEGFWNVTGATADGRRTRFYAQPQLLVDVSALAGAKPGTFQAGIEYLYDHHKYGSGVTESTPQLLLKLHL